MKCQRMLLTSSRTSPSLWKHLDQNYFPELNGFAQRFFIFFAFLGCFEAMLRNKRNKRGIFWTWDSSSSECCVHPSTACKPEPLPGGRVWLQGVRWSSKEGRRTLLRHSCVC